MFDYLWCMIDFLTSLFAYVFGIAFIIGCLFAAWAILFHIWDNDGEPPLTWIFRMMGIGNHANKNQKP